MKHGIYKVPKTSITIVVEEKSYYQLYRILLERKFTIQYANFLKILYFPDIDYQTRVYLLMKLENIHFY